MPTPFELVCTASTRRRVVLRTALSCGGFVSAQIAPLEDLRHFRAAH
jgi:hypothetical protein